MKKMTLCILTRGIPPNEILLGLKKTGFGKGKYSGFGGKVEADETIEEATIRELEEEAGIRISIDAIQKVGCLNFLFPARPDWDQEVHVFVAEKWDGEPVESIEMKPAWFKVREIPYETMWQDASYWLPSILRGNRLRARFVHKDDNQTIDEHELEEWNCNE